MTHSNNQPITEPRSSAAGVRRLPPGLRSGLLLAVAAASLALGWLGGVAGLLGAAAAGLLLPWLQRAGNATPGADSGPDDAEPRVSGGRVGAEVMVTQVVPVWGKQLEITRVAAGDGLGALLETFSQLAGALGTLSNQIDHMTPSIDAGAVDGALTAQSTALEALLAPSRRAFEQRDAAVAELTRCADAVTELRQLARGAREIGKHTRLVAFNASIEANRGSSGAESGAQAVANETRMLAGRMAEVGERIDRLVTQLDRTLSAERLRSEISDTAPDELRLELELRAREALAGLMGALGSSLQNSGDIKAASETLRNQLDEAFVNFQFGDRLSQMLAIVGNDMHNFARWVSANPYATQSDAAEWLANLEGSYTMEEQRSQHHGNVHIDRGSEVEFF